MKNETNGKIENNRFGERRDATSMWRNIGNVFRRIKRCIRGNTEFYKLEHGDNGISKRPNGSTNTDPSPTGLEFTDKVALVGVIMTLMMLAMLIAPRYFEPGSNAFGACYFAIEFTAFATLSLSICLLFFTRKDHFAFSIMRFNSFFCFIWFAWGALDKFSQLASGIYRTASFYNTDLVGKIEIGFTGAFVFTLLYELWKHRKSLTA